jgi:hypothetical protein
MITEVELVQKSSHGGARIGAGRKSKHSLESRDLFKYVLDRRFPEILEKSIELALKGDKEMIKMLTDQYMGRPSQALSVQKLESKQEHIYHHILNNPKVKNATTNLDSVLKSVIYDQANEDKEKRVPLLNF